MLNEDLMSENQKETLKLKLTIEHFKKYDKERKEYYKQSMIELGQLRSFVEELESDSNGFLLREYKQQFKCYKQKYDRLVKSYNELMVKYLKLQNERN